MFKGDKINNNKMYNILSDIRQGVVDIERIDGNMNENSYPQNNSGIFIMEKTRPQYIMKMYINFEHRP